MYRPILEKLYQLSYAPLVDPVHKPPTLIPGHPLLIITIDIFYHYNSVVLPSKILYEASSISS
jgi:hypothetical protein